MYKPRVSLKNILQGQTTFIDIKNKSYSTQNVPKNLKFQKCLLLSKLTRYDFERNRQKQLNNNDFVEYLKKRGTNYELLMHCHNLHKIFEKKLIDVLKNLNLDIRVVNRYTYTEESIKWSDVIFPIGGDGTFLLAASKIYDNLKPVIGFNSDPHRSVGYLCLPKKYTNEIGEALERLKNGQFEWLNRNRIRTTLINHLNKDVKNLHEHEDFEIRKQVAQAPIIKDGKILPFLALNEVFMGESVSARVSHLEMSLNGSNLITDMKCSGICVCAGTGSTSWNYFINRMSKESVAEVLKMLDIKSEGEKASLPKQIADLFNQNLIFAPDDNRMSYTIRDLIAVGVWPQPKGIKPRGYAHKIYVKSCCFNADLVIDGGLSFTFNDGTAAVLEIRPEDALCTVVFKD